MPSRRYANFQRTNPSENQRLDQQNIRNDTQGQPRLLKVNVHDTVRFAATCRRGIETAGEPSARAGACRAPRPRPPRSRADRERKARHAESDREEARREADQRRAERFEAPSPTQAIQPETITPDPPPDPPPVELVPEPSADTRDTSTPPRSSDRPLKRLPTGVAGPQRSAFKPKSTARPTRPRNPGR